MIKIPFEKARIDFHYTKELEDYRNEGLLQYSYDPESMLIRRMVFSPKAFELKFKDKPLSSKIIFRDAHDLLDNIVLTEEMLEKTYHYKQGDYILEYGYAQIGSFKNKAIFCFSLKEKQLVVYLLEWLDENRLTERQLRTLEKIDKNFEYLRTLSNVLIISDTMLFDCKTYPTRFEEFFEILIERLQERFWLMDKQDYVYLAGFVVGSYFQEMIETAPYIFVGGEKGSGKSRVLEALADMCYRTSRTGNISIAVMVRELDWHRITLIFDEIVKDEERQTVEEKELFAMLRSGIRQGNYYKRMKNERAIGYYNAFGIKAFATNRDLPSDIKDRCFVITMFKNPKFIPKVVTKSNYYAYINNFLSEMRIYYLLNYDIEEGKQSLNEFIKNLINAGIEGRSAEVLGGLLFFVPRKYYPDNLKIKLESRLDEERYSETYDVYLAIKSVVARELGIEENQFSLNDMNKRVDIRFDAVVGGFCSLNGIDAEKLTERDKRSLMIRIGLILRNKFGFKTYRKSVREGSEVTKVTYVTVDMRKLFSFYERYEREVVIKDYERRSIFDIVTHRNL